MAQLPISDTSFLVRTDADHSDAWERLISAVRTETKDGFRAYVDFVDDARWYRGTEDQLRAAAPRHEMMPSVLFIADDLTLTTEGLLVLVVDLDERRTGFRYVASALCQIENNLNIANMDWEEFEGATDAQRVFHGFPEV
ncbi:DUF6924 domain-containing protein [Microbacterium sp. ASV49]|uniref:DUF6924 domain-containing protein n=1 Tax=Microbacterium candidum TaxID=3041922 RepID=A0ABT7N229_9MICO|nr:hypothetical protein [Microbacterium sp. ASV49]MDL9980731.1 hypothetical protein [Microbacterium sp. ASV49]